MQFERSVGVVIFPAFCFAWSVGPAVGDAAVVFGCGPLADDGGAAFVAAPVRAPFFEDMLQMGAQHFGVTGRSIVNTAITAVNITSTDKTAIVDDPFAVAGVDRRLHRGGGGELGADFGVGGEVFEFWHRHRRENPDDDDDEDKL